MVAECRARKVRYHVGRDSDAERVYRAEAGLERQLPSGTVGIEEAQRWVKRIAFAEDVDPPRVIYSPLSRRLDGLAFTEDATIVVGAKNPTRLTLLHELAHFLGTTGHGSRFRRDLVRLVRTHLSRTHADVLESQFGDPPLD